jgi:hypothetical protein
VAGAVVVETMVVGGLERLVVAEVGVTVVVVGIAALETALTVFGLAVLKNVVVWTVDVVEPAAVTVVDVVLRSVVEVIRRAVVAEITVVDVALNVVVTVVV